MLLVKKECLPLAAVAIVPFVCVLNSLVYVPAGEETVKFKKSQSVGGVSGPVQYTVVLTSSSKCIFGIAIFTYICLHCECL